MVKKEPCRFTMRVSKRKKILMVKAMLQKRIFHSKNKGGYPNNQKQEVLNLNLMKFIIQTKPYYL